MNWPELGQFLKDVGFPIAVAVFVLYRLNGQMKELTNAMRSLERMLVLVSEALTTHRDESRQIWREARDRWRKDDQRKETPP